MRINFKQAEQIMEILDSAYEMWNFPVYVIYNYITTQLGLINVFEQFERHTSDFANGVYIRQKFIENNKEEKLKAIENYNKFKEYYKKSLQEFEIK